MAQAEWAIAALLDIEDIANFLDRRSAVNACNFVRRLTTAVDDLVDFPERGRLVPEMETDGRRDVRELIYQNYRIVYYLKDGKVLILGVWHAVVKVRRRLRDRLWDLT